MSRSSKRRNRLGVFLAALSLATTAKSNFASAMEPYSNNQNLNAEKHVISDIEWEMILNRYDDVSSCNAALNNLKSRVTALMRYISVIRNHAKSFESKLSEKHRERPNMWQRFIGSVEVNAAADSIEQKTNAAYMSIKGYVDNIDTVKRDMVERDSGGLMPSLKEFLNFVDNAFPGIYVTEKIKTEYENLSLNLLDLKASVEDLPTKVDEAKNSSGTQRYDKYDTILEKLNSSLRLVRDANGKLDIIQNIVEQFFGEIGSLANKVEARNLEKTKKEEEERARIEKEAQEKLEREKREAEEQKQKALEEAKRNKEEAEKKFLDEKSNWQRELANILDRIDKELEDTCKNSDPDIGELLKKNQENAVTEFKSSVEKEITNLDDMKEYSEVNLQKVMDMRVRFAEITENKRKLDRSIRDCRNDLIKQKKELGGLKNEVVSIVEKLKSDLDLAWNEEIGKLVSDEDKGRFTSMAKSSYEAAKKIVDQMIGEVGQVKIDLTRTSKSDLENLRNRMEDRKNKVIRAIDGIKNKGLNIRIVAMKDAINTMLKERDKLWTEFKNKYEPSRLTEDLRAKTSNIWQNIEGLYNDEVKWSRSIGEILGSREVNEEVAIRLDEAITELSGRSGIFKNALEDAERDIQVFLDAVRISRDRRLAFERIYVADCIDLIRKEVGEAWVNTEPAHSERIARVVDSFLPGTYEYALALANAIRLGGAQAFLLSGPPGHGKTTLLEYVAAAIGARVYNVDYNKMANEDGAQYAYRVIQEIAGSERCIIVLDEFDVASRKAEPGQPRPKSAANINSFMNVFSDAMNKKETNACLLAGASNESKQNIDSANFSRMTGYLVMGVNPQFDKIVNYYYGPIKAPSDAISKEAAVEMIIRHCESLHVRKKTVSPRTIKNSILSVAKSWCDNVNKNKSKGDPGYVELYDAQVSPEEVCQKIDLMSGF